MEEKPIKQAFGSPAGKSYLAPRIVEMIPPHKTYVEPFAGGAAVYFKKSPSEREVLGDKDSEIAFAFKFLKNMTPQQFKKLKAYDWVKSEPLFRKLKDSKPRGDIEHFRKFYYVKKASFTGGGLSYNWGLDNETISVERLPRIKERLRRTDIQQGDALTIIKKHNNPNTFFYLDPPYPGRTFVGQSFKDWTKEDLAKLVSTLRNTKGKFILSLGSEHAKLLPKKWHTKRVWVSRNLGVKTGQYETISSNFNPKHIKPKRRSVRRPATLSLGGMRG